jgi:GLPGLI family protein
MPKETIVTAWYTPEIPVNQGPDKYWDRFDLEVNDGKTVILCSKVVLNPKLNRRLKRQPKGKKFLKKEFDETAIKKCKK